MTRYFTRSCPRSGGHVGITMREPETALRLQAVNGKCVRCSYRLAWIVVKGNRPGVLESAYRGLSYLMILSTR